jgi:hypothetical protein
LLDICADVARPFDVVFNVTKSVVGIVGVKICDCMPSLELQGRSLSWVHVLKYLGIEFQLGVYLKANISARVNKFTCAVCAVLRQKLHGYEKVYVELIIKKCMPILFYGLGAFALTSEMLNAISQVWNMAFRFVFGLRKHDSTRHVFLNCNTMSLKFLFEERVLIFLESLICCENVLLHNLWCWLHSSIWCINLFTQYGLCGRETKSAIKCRVNEAFLDYCA